MSHPSASMPLCYALAQVRFNPVPGMAEYVPRLQDALRREGWPEFVPQKSQSFEVKQVEGQEPAVRSLERERWVFSNAEASEGFILQPDSLVFHTTGYRGFKELLGSMLRGMERLHETVELQFISRVGLRYLNVVDPASMGGSGLDELVPERLLGLSASQGAGLRHSFSETVFEQDKTTVVSRALVSPRGVVWPPDLQPVMLEAQARFRIHDHTVIMLDNDVYRGFPQPHIPLDNQRLSEVLRDGHDTIGQMFREMTTDKARSIWGVYE
ncbi:TIGR04255 family protein [Thioalkalivibrio sp. ALJT]|uniref:TIGR04255 family protein n=1 Tax=Thioalkalivibrio sp. ALJT TaxID=1158146 RepID=UPI0003A5E1D3|nr:TIGR04255 family protein [Thioalkalivibrio sp. ALJT]